jgi:hypothetical protein
MSGVDSLLPLARFPAAIACALRGLLLDIDETLTTEGTLTADAYAALERAKRSGLIVVPVTGRPAGWCDHIARMWPVDAVVGENGAFYFRYDHASRRLVKRFRDDDATRADARARLIAVRDRILAEIPGTAVASDQPYREADLAIDCCEDVPRLSDAAIDRIVAVMREHGMTAKVSSIHVNGWFGAYDKLGMTRALLKEAFALDLERERDAFVFVGDSPNDAPMFEFFPHAVGVANVAAFGGRIAHWPRYVTPSPAGAGFAELVDSLLRLRAAASR